MVHFSSLDDKQSVSSLQKKNSLIRPNPPPYATKDWKQQHSRFLEVNPVGGKRTPHPVSPLAKQATSVVSAAPSSAGSQSGDAMSQPARTLTG